mmetsp:Transcript_10470/g.25321  ORF Transcript_10470/g.25321 Transcript_10470/m.25321 type:complete len:128 (-) Transcript_10470:81-464(-)
MLSSQQQQMDAVPWKSLRERSDLELKSGKEDEEVLKTRSDPSSAGRKVLHRVFTSTTAEPLSPRGRRRSRSSSRASWESVADDESLCGSGCEGPRLHSRGRTPSPCSSDEGEVSYHFIVRRAKTNIF